MARRERISSPGRRLTALVVIVNLVVAGAVVLLSTTPVIAIRNVQRLDTGFFQESAPAVDGNLVAFRGRESLSADIYVIDVNTRELRRITQNGSVGPPVISGSRVAWQYYDGNRSFAFVQDVKASVPVRVPFSAWTVAYVSIDGDHVVATGMSQFFFPPIFDKVLHFNLATGTETTLALHMSDHDGSVIYGNLVAWSSDRESYGDVYVAKLETEETFRITWNQTAEFEPDIFGNLVVYTDVGNPNLRNWDIYVHDLARNHTRLLTANNLDDDFSPAIHGDRVAWAGYTGP